MSPNAQREELRQSILKDHPELPSRDVEFTIKSSKMIDAQLEDLDLQRQYIVTQLEKLGIAPCSGTKKMYVEDDYGNMSHVGGIVCGQDFDVVGPTKSVIGAPVNLFFGLLNYCKIMTSNNIIDFVRAKCCTMEFCYIVT